MSTSPKEIERIKRIAAKMPIPEHSPAPWRVEPPKGTLCAWTVEADRTVAFIARTIGRNAEEDANARLIAAAPELLNALRAVKALALPGATHIHKVCDAAIALTAGGKE